MFLPLKNWFVHFALIKTEGLDYYSRSRILREAQAHGTAGLPTPYRDGLRLSFPSWPFGKLGAELSELQGLSAVSPVISSQMPADPVHFIRVHQLFTNFIHVHRVISLTDGFAI